MYNPMSPGEGLSGSSYESIASTIQGTRGMRGLGEAPPPPSTKLRVKPIPGALPGWPGFFQWLSAFNPQLHRTLSVSLPSLAFQKGYLSPGAQLVMPPGLSGRMGRMRGMRGLGQDEYSYDPSTFDPGIPDVTPIDISIPSVTMAPPDTSSWAQIANTIATAGAAILPLVQQQQLLAVNVSRAKAGQPPLSLAQYESASSGVNVGLNPSTQSALLTLALIGGGIFLVGRLLR